MPGAKTGFLTFILLGGIVLWRNRFKVQHQLESLGIKTPLLKGSLTESARSVSAKVSGKAEHGASIAENYLRRQSGRS